MMIPGTINAVASIRMHDACMALAMARGTLRHGETIADRHRNKCALAMDFANQWIFDHDWTHGTYASALLDGFSVDEVTLAGG